MDGRQFDEALTQAILSQTSGAACARAEALVCDFVDGTLDGLDRDLVASHLEHCAPCAELAGVLARVGEAVHELAVLEPPAAFIDLVLDATSRRVRAQSLGARVAAWWERATFRPRFALEVAYVFTLLLVLVVGNPVAAFRDAGSQVAAAATPRVKVAAARVAGPIETLRSSAESVLRSARELADTVAGELRIATPGTTAGPGTRPSAWNLRLPSVFQTLRDWWQAAVKTAERLWMSLFGSDATVQPDSAPDLPVAQPSASPGPARSVTPWRPSGQAMAPNPPGI